MAYLKIITSVMALFLMSGVSAWAQDNPETERLDGFGPLGHFDENVPNEGAQENRRLWMKELGLSAEQVQKMREIREKFRPRMVEARKNMFAAKKQMKTLIGAPDSSKESLQEAHNAIRDRARVLSDIQFEVMWEMRQLMTPEQKKKFSEHMGPNPNMRRAAGGKNAHWWQRSRRNNSENANGAANGN